MKPAYAPLPILLAAICASLTSCSGRIDRITVDVSEKRITAERAGRIVMVCPCETSRRGTGSRIGSKRTPLGEFEIAAKERGHRFGRVLRLNGYQGYRRGILIHRNLDGKPDGTRGCISPINDGDHLRLWRWTRVGAHVRIQK